MKKIFSFVALIAMFMGAVNAQEFEDNFSYSFWSNWSAGVGIQYTKHFNNNWTISEGANLGAEIRFQKKLNKHWDARVIGCVPGFIKGGTDGFDRYGLAMLGFDWVPWKHMYVFLDGGLEFRHQKYYDRFTLAADAGLGLKFNVFNHSTIYGELGVDCLAELTNDMTFNNAFAKAGWMYNFGATKVDRIAIEQRRLLVENGSDVKQDDSIKDSLNSVRNRENELIERISCLESHDSSLTYELTNLYDENDSLKGVIESLAIEQINYYALPFSVLFDNDSYKINTSEWKKIRAVASFMNDDTSIHYTVIGFCDKTGSVEYNDKLSVKRAETVKNALISFGVKEEQITIGGNGFNTPFSDGKLEVNRRVSFYRNF